MRLFTLDDFAAVNPVSSPLWTRATHVAASLWLRAGARVTVRLGGPMPVPDRPVIYAVNHSHKYDFLPLRWFLYGRGLELVTWIKPRAWLDPASALFFGKTGNIPVASRGYVIAADARAVWGRRPDEEAYRLLRDHVDRDAPLGDRRDLAALLATPRSMLGAPFDPGREPYRDAVHRVFAKMMKETLALSRRAMAAGRHFHICPQGTVSPRLIPARTGAIQAAIALGIPIIPVGLSGMTRVFFPDSLRHRSGELTLRFGPPITPPALPGLRPFELDSEREHAEALAEQAERLTEAMNRLLDPPDQLAPETDRTGTRVERFL